MPPKSVIAGIAVAVLAVALWRVTQPKSPHELRLTQITFDAGVTTSPAISPDGSAIAYASDRDTGGPLELYVQRLPGGAPLRLTNGQDVTDPAFSPDGATVAFVSRQGIHTVPAAGGPARLLASPGVSPHYSPDGRSIAYRVGGKVWIVAAAGGASRPFHSEIAGVRALAWSPDGQTLLLGDARGLVVAPLAGGPAESIGFPATTPDDFSWSADGLLYTERAGFVRNIYRCPLDRRGKVAGPAVRLTNGTELMSRPAVARDGQIIFASGRDRYDVWAFPLDAATGKAAGAPSRLTGTLAPTANPDLSADGSKLLFGSSINGFTQVWERDLATGRQWVAATGPEGATFGRFVRSTSQILSLRPAGNNRDVCLDERRIAAGGRPWDAAGSMLLLGEGAIDALDLKTGQRTPLLQPPAGTVLSEASYSPDGRWILFLARASNGLGRIYCAPAKGGAWIALNSETLAADKPRFSPAGRLVYFLADTERRSVQALRFDPQSGRARGDAFVALDFRGPRFSLAGVNPAAIDLSIARQTLATIVCERTVNIWIADSVPAR